jgi:opacity protein-like surface antigen
MKRLLCGALAAVSLAAGAQTVALTTTAGGGYTGSVVQAANGSFFDTFTFTPGALNGNVTVTLTEAEGSINFFTAILNGQGFGFLPENGGTAFVFNATVTADQPLQLLVTGYAGDASTFTPTDGSYLAEFTISAVPEPRNEALLLAGLGIAAAAARRRRTS